MTSTVSSMYDVAAWYLAAITAAMGSTTAGPPTRSFVSPGQIAWDTDCDQAAVQIMTLSEEVTSPLSPTPQTGHRHPPMRRVNLVGLAGFAVRCVDVSEGNQNVFQALTDASLDAQALAVYEDGWAIWNWVTALIGADKLFAGPCGDIHFDLGQPITPQGGLAGWQFTLRAELDGYAPDITGFGV